MVDVLQGETFGNWQGKLGKPCTIFLNASHISLLTLIKKGIL